eukprot:Rmarinus@m.19596
MNTTEEIALVPLRVQKPLTRRHVERMTMFYAKSSTALSVSQMTCVSRTSAPRVTQRSMHSRETVSARHIWTAKRLNMTEVTVRQLLQEKAAEMMPRSCVRRLRATRVCQKTCVCCCLGPHLARTV